MTCTYTNSNGTKKRSYNICQIKSSHCKKFYLSWTGHEKLKVENA